MEDNKKNNERIDVKNNKSDIRPKKRRKIYTAKRSIGPPIGANVRTISCRSNYRGAKVYKIINTFEVQNRINKNNNIKKIGRAHV